LLRHNLGVALRFSFSFRLGLFIAFASIFLLALAFVMTNATFFLTAVLLLISVFLPIVAPIFASVVSNKYIFAADQVQAIVCDVAC
jgi:hypothetical protein